MTEQLGGVVSTVAQFFDQVIFAALPGVAPPAGNQIPVVFNITIGGLIMGSGSFGAQMRVLGNAAGANIDFQLNDTPTGCTMVQRGVTLHSALVGQCSNGTAGVGGTLVTDPTFAPLNQPQPLNLTLTVSGFGNPGNFFADFSHSLDLAIGSDVFTLPAGFTVNDVNGFIVNNRFVGAAAPVPEPSSAALLVAGLAGWFGFRRRWGRTRA